MFSADQASWERYSLMIRCEEELVKKLVSESEQINLNGLDIEIKNIPDDDREGVLDKREFFIRNAILAFQKMTPFKFSVEGMRLSTKTQCLDICRDEIINSSFEIDSDGRKVTCYRYERADSADAVRPVLIYIHGGSFMASSAKYYEQPCRFAAEQSGCVVLNIEYGLAPENRYPAAIHDVLNLITYVYQNAADLRIDNSRIGLFGDSAGANLALAAIIDNKSEAKVSYCGLFYPCVDLYSGDGLYDWNESDYSINEEERELILSRLQLGRCDGKGNDSLMAGILLNYTGERYEEVKRAPDVSPVYADLSVMPFTGFFSAEYDGLRIQSEYYARLLKKAGIPFKFTRYRGVTHAFLDYFGIVPQGEAAILQMCGQVKDIWGLN